MSSEHRHVWVKHPTDKQAKICSVCELVIVPKKRLGEQAIDCIHDWYPLDAERLVCLRCSYVARGNSYKGWWNKFGKLNWRERPYCLNCREPVMEYGRMCSRCDKVVKPVVL